MAGSCLEEIIPDLRLAVQQLERRGKLESCPFICLMVQ